MTLLGTALRPAATRVMLLGSGELGKEVAIECQRLGIETIAVDRYPDAPAMQVAHRSHVINMLHGETLRALIAPESEFDESEMFGAIKLSKRQKQLIAMLDYGFSNREIATELGLSEHTVKVHLLRLFRRLSVNSRTQALHVARLNGLL